MSSHIDVLQCACYNLSHSENPLSVMKGHQDRVCRVAFHPSGDYVASASFDTTWRLWDVNTAKELLLQEGHSKEVYSVEFQNDGALVVSGFVFNFPVEVTDLILSFFHTEDSMLLVASGISEQARQPWFSMVTYKPYLPQHSHRMGPKFF